MAGGEPTAVLETILAHPGRLTPGALDAVGVQALADAAASQHVVPLVAHALRVSAPESAHAAALHAAASAWALREAAEREAIAGFLDAAAGLPLLFFKGASMAYGVYGSPVLRMKDDWDVIAAPGAHAAAARALLAAGFLIDPLSKPGRVRMRQQSFRRDVAGSQCIVDLHVRPLNPPALADRISFDDLARRGVPLPALHASARGVGDDAALVLACVHRLAHHSDEPRLAWDYDILLLARRATPDVIAGIESCAARWRAEAFVCAETRRVFARFGEAVPAALAAALARLGAAPPADAAFLREHRSRAREFALDWRVLGWRDRAALVRETLLPDTAFMRASTGSRLPLPLLYVTRIARGVRAWAGLDRRG